MTRPTILCGTDLTPLGTQAARVAAALAAARGGSLLLVHVQDAPTDDLESLDDSLRAAAEVYRQRIEARRARAQQALDAAAAELGDAFGIPVRTERVAGRPCEAIMDVADAVDAALVVVGPHGEQRGRLMDRLLGTT
ncbi:MAG: universal stress protein, partial [Myxococcota bacterium]